MIKNYSAQDMSKWSGRIDSNDDFDSFRWHQWVKPIDLNNEKLEIFSGKLAFAFIGFESDIGIEKNKGRKGAAEGPNAIRKELSNRPCNFSQKIKLFDTGNISADGLSLSEAQEILGSCVKKLLELDYFPIVLGGGHETAFGHYKGIYDYFTEKENKPRIGIVNFDAHFDNRPYKEIGGSSGTMFRQIYDLNTENGIDYNYLVLGIQKSANTVSLFKFAEENNTKYILGKDISTRDIYNIFEDIEDFLLDVDHLYITICSDVFSSSVAPGVSAPQPLGLDPELVLKLLKYILSSNKSVSFDICEVSPRFDHDSTTASLAAIVIFSVVTKLASRIHN